MLGRIITGCGTINGGKPSNITPLKWFDKLELDPSVNLGRGRFIPFRKPKFHHTVKERMDYKPLKYKPRAIYDDDEVYV